MEPAQQISTRPKIAKSSSNKLPDAFFTSRTVGVVAVKKPPNPKPKVRQQQKGKSRNPFVPVRECIKQFKNFSSELQSFKQNMSQDKLSKLSLQKIQTNNSKLTTQQKINYQNCLTIATIRKYDRGILKKILHVPTLTLHYLRQSPINNTDKNDIGQWIQHVNGDRRIHGIKILQLFWNTPQGFYSVLYDYYQGYTLYDLLDNIQVLPLTLIQQLVQTHMLSNPAIFSSQIIFSGKGEIKYLPFYEQNSNQVSGHDLVQRLQDLLDDVTQNQLKIKVESSLVGRLGLMILICFFGNMLIQQDLNALQNIQQHQVQKYQKKCCVLHNLLDIPYSLSKLYLQGFQDKNKALKIEEFICSALQYKPKLRLRFQKVLQSSIIMNKIQQTIPLHEILRSMEPPASKSLTSISAKRVNKILEAIQLILQNLQKVNLQISENSQQVKLLAKQLGITGNQAELTNLLIETYGQWLK